MVTFRINMHLGRYFIMPEGFVQYYAIINIHGFIVSCMNQKRRGGLSSYLQLI